MIDYNPYVILGLEPPVSESEIKKAYRNKAKTLHPDRNPGNKKAEEKFKLLVKAYEDLTNQISNSFTGKPGKEEEDSFYQGFQKYRKQYQTKFKTFDYRKWLTEQEDYKSRSKLIIYDLFHGRKKEAVDEFKSMNMNHHDFMLSLPPEDFMDYGYLLAEELASFGEYYDAIILLEHIIFSERNKPYFKKFFIEVSDFTRKILRHKIKGKMNDELALDVYERALGMGFSSKDNCYFWRKMSEIYNKIGDKHAAFVCQMESEKY